MGSRMKIWIKKVIAAALVLAMALSAGGCGSTVDLGKKLGEAAARSAKTDEEKKQEAAEADGTAEPEATQKAVSEPSKEDETDIEKGQPEEAEEASPAPLPTPREGVTGLDDIFSGSGSTSPDELEPDDFFSSEDYDHIPYDTYVTQNLEKCKKDLEADDGPVQSDVESDTIQWFNATYAVLTENNDNDRTLVGGMERNLTNAVFMRYQLYTGWGIESRTDADATIAWLFDEGHREEIEELIDALSEGGLLDVEEEDFDDFAEENFGQFGSETVNRLKTVYICNKECGENGILAWDLCRINQVAAWCYVAGYYSLEESLEIQLLNSGELQAAFDSWDDMMESYLYGFQYWVGDADHAEYGVTSERRNIYNSLKELKDGPYSMDFDMELSRSWGI